MVPASTVQLALAQADPPVRATTVPPVPAVAAIVYCRMNVAVHVASTSTSTSGLSAAGEHPVPVQPPKR